MQQHFETVKVSRNFIQKIITATYTKLYKKWKNSMMCSLKDIVNLMIFFVRPKFNRKLFKPFQSCFFDKSKRQSILKHPNKEGVRVVFCLRAVKMSRVVREVPRFGAGIVWGTIPSGFPVSWIIVPGSSRNGYGTSPNLWVQKKLVKFWQGTEHTWLRSAKFFWEFLSYSALDLLRDLADVILS